MDNFWTFHVNGKLQETVELSQHGGFFKNEVSKVRVKISKGYHSLSVKDGDDTVNLYENFQGGKEYIWQVGSSNWMGTLKTKRFEEVSI